MEPPSNSNMTPVEGFQRILRRADVFLLGVVATFNLNLVSSMAASGRFMLLLLAAAAVMFALPQAVAVVELNRRFPGEGGMAEWVQHYFGDFAAFLTAWSYWAVNVVYVPTLIVFLVGNLDFLIWGEQPAEREQSGSTLAACLLLLWLIVGICISGFGVSRWLSNAGGIGMLLALIVLLLLCGWSIATQEPVLSVAEPERMPFDWSVAAGFGVFCLALVGPELGAVLGDEIRESTQVVPWSVWRVTLLAVVCYALGTGVLLIALPVEAIHSVQGVLAAATAIAQPLHATWVVSLLGVLLSVSAVGAAVTWFAGASRMLWVAAHDGMLPPRFAQLSTRWNTPVLALIVQGIVSTVILVTAFVGSRAQQVFVTLVDLSVVLQLIPFAAMFAGLVSSGVVERGSRGRWLIVAGVVGAASSLAGIGLAFVPSRRVESVWTHEANLLFGCGLFFASCVGIFACRSRWSRRESTSGE